MQLGIKDKFASVSIYLNANLYHYLRLEPSEFFIDNMINTYKKLTRRLACYP